MRLLHTITVVITLALIALSVVHSEGWFLVAVPGCFIAGWLDRRATDHEMRSVKP